MFLQVLTQFYAGPMDVEPFEEVYKGFMEC